MIRIAVNLGPSTTATHCGDCPGVYASGKCKYSETQREHDQHGALRTADCLRAQLPQPRQADPDCSCAVQIRNRIEYRVHHDRCPVHGTKPRLRVMP